MSEQAFPQLSPLRDLHLSDEWASAFAWIERRLGGSVVRAARQARWRPAWFLELERGGETLPLYFRGERGESDHGIYALQHEMRVLQVLEQHGIPVPHVYGLCEAGKTGIVMETSPGRANLATAASAAEREAVLDHYMEILARIHDIDPDAFVAIGMERPVTAEQLGLVDFDAWEKTYRRNKRRPEPAIEFAIRWLRRNIPAVPEPSERASFICADSGQFLFDDCRVTAVLDLELATLGDPAADLAGLRTRDLSEPLGDLSRAVRRYEALTGRQVDRSLIDYHTVRFGICTPLAVAHLVASPPAGIDFVQYLSWYLVYTRTPFQVMAETSGLEVVRAELPEGEFGELDETGDALTGYAPGHRALRAALDQLPMEGDFAAYQLESAQRLALFLRRADAMGAAAEALDLDDVASVLGDRPSNQLAADRELEALVLKAGPERDAELIPLFHRRMQRQEAILAPVMRELEDVAIQDIR